MIGRMFPPQGYSVEYEPYSYVIFIDDDGYIKAKNGKTGRIEFSSTDASTVIQSAINALPNGGKILLKKGNYIINNTLTIASPITLMGEGHRNTVLVAGSPIASGHVIYVHDTMGVHIKNLKIDSAVSKTGGSGIMFSNVSYLLSSITEVEIANQYAGVHLLNCTAVYLDRLDIRNTTYSVIIIEGGNDHYLSNIIADNPATSQPFAGLRIVGSYSTWVHNCDFIHCGIGLLIDPRIGETVEWLFFTNCAFDSGDNINGNIFISEDNGGTVRGLTFVNCWSGSGAGIGVQIKGGKGIRFIGLKCVNNRGHGFLFQGGVNNSLEDSEIISNDTDNTGEHGVAVAAGVSGFRIINNRIGNIWGVPGYQRYGILLVSPVGDNYQIIGNDVRDNVLGGMAGVVTGPTRIVKNNIGFVTENRGVAIFSGNGTQTTFTIPHGLSGTPSSWRVEAGSSDAKGDKYVTADATNLTVVFATAPPAGTNNVVLVWSAEL
jgi:hypothetical protein